VTTHVERSIEVAVPVRTAYDQWTRFEEFPHFMSGVEQVRQVGDAMTHWTAQIAGVRREWDAEIVEQVPDKKVAWAATTGATNAGAVYFDEVGADRTRVRLTLEFEPEGLVERIGDVLDVVDRQAVADLDRFKEFIEKSQGSVAGGWRGTIEDGDGVSESTGQQTNAGAAGAAAREKADAVPGDIVAVGPTGGTESTLTTDGGDARSAAPVADVTALGHSGDPVAVDPDAVSNRQGGDPLDSRKAGTAGPTADAAGRSSAGVAGFGTDTGLSSDDPNSGVVTGDPGARTASHAGGGTGDLVGEVGTGGHHGAWTDEPGARDSVTEASTDPVGEDWDSAGGTTGATTSRSTGEPTGGGGTEASSATSGTDEAWASGGSGPGEDRGVRDTGGEGVVKRDFADEDISTDDVVARDFANRDISGEGVVERDFANRDITERDIANRGVTEESARSLDAADAPGIAGGVGAGLDPLDPRAGTADDPDNPARPRV
jgi:carbon monoxide dehydrogenase subunit G